MKRLDAAEPVLVRYRTREIRPCDIETIQRVVETHGSRGRKAIAERLCELWEWRQPRGNWKISACCELLRHLDRQGLVAVPGQRHTRRRAWGTRNPLSEHPLPVYPIAMERGDLNTLVLRKITREEWLGWSILIDRFHYLGYRQIVGEHIRYAAYLDGQIVACLAWASAALRCPARDHFIGWDDATRKQRLPSVVNNTRFLIFPWIRVPHLASKILATNLRRLNADWQQTWGHGLVLAETFVDAARFRGTCYRAANWMEVGVTQGRGKKGNQYHPHGRPKTVWLYPLHRHWQQRLTAPEPPLHPPGSIGVPIHRGLPTCKPWEV
ncbi:MAG: DUF4338 domain-containing protein [Planctomycetes bacterium]|nr:DUF4338 domain-containing protein [Planctomycetota bacterium]